MGDQRAALLAPALSAWTAPKVSRTAAADRIRRQATSLDHPPDAGFDFSRLDIFPREAERAAADVLAPPPVSVPAPAPAAPAPAPAAPAPTPAPSPAVPRSAEAPKEEELEEGGDPLPEHLRTFFEGRFGHDFSAVRIHTGERAEAIASAVSARAFTYGDHIWLGSGEAVAASELLAHELTHVVQQRAEPAAPVALRRKFDNDFPWWWPEESFTARTDLYHDEVVEALSKAGDTFSEAPLPQGGRFSDNTGRADLYKATRTIGVYFPKPDYPDYLAPNQPINKKGAPYGKHQTESAPHGNKGKVERMREAPDSILLGEVKPPWFSPSALGSTMLPGSERALSQYASGIEGLAREINALPADVRESQTWTPKVDYLSLAIPGKYKGRAQKKPVVLVKGKPPRKGHISGLTLYEHPPVKATARLQVAQSSKPGVFHYAWVPIKEPEFNIGKRASRLPADVQKLIMDPLFEPPPIKAGPAPPKKKGRRKAKRVDRLARRFERDVYRHLRRKPRTPPEKDGFDRAKWDADFIRLGKEKTDLGGTPEGQRAEAQHAVNDAHEALREQGFDVGPLSSKEKKLEKGQDKVDFWLSTRAKAFAWLREHFGRAFVYIAQVFQKFRERVTDFFHPAAKPKISTGDSLTVKVLEAAWKLIKIAGKKLINDVMDALWDSLARGIAKKIRELIPEEVNETLEKAQAFAEKIGTEIKEAADKVASALHLDSVMSVIEKVQDVYNEIKDILALVNDIRWLIRVAQCASPPGWGCLKLLLAPLTNYILGQIAETCWFQEKISPYVERMDFLRNFSRNVAGEIVSAVQGALPRSLADFLEPPSVDWRVSDSPEAKCRDKPGGPTRIRIPTEADKKMAELAEEIGEERLMEVSKLLDKMGADPNAPITEEQVEALRKFLVDNDIAVEQLKNYVDHFPAVPDGLGDLGEFLDGVKKLPENMRLQPGDQIEDVGQGKGDAEGAGGGGGGGQGQGAGAGAGAGVGAEEEGEQSGKGGGYVATYDAQKHVAANWKRDALTPKRYMIVVDPSWDHQAGSEAPYKVTLGLFEKGQVTALLYNAEAWCVREKDRTAKDGYFEKWYEVHVPYEVPRRNFVFRPNVAFPGKIFAKKIPRNRKKPLKGAKK